METNFSIMPVVFIAGLNKDQRNWKVDVYCNGDIYCSCYGKTRDEAEANAKLIAASTILLQALESLMYAVKQFTKGNIGEIEYFEEEVKKAESAIIKATE